MAITERAAGEQHVPPFEWQEYRGMGECFRVRAEKQDGKWVFQDKSDWENRWYDVPASAEIIAQAEERSIEALSNEDVDWRCASDETGLAQGYCIDCSACCVCELFCTLCSFPGRHCCQHGTHRQVYSSEGRQERDMHLMHECADDDDDMVVVFWALVVLALRGELASALDDLYTKMLETPLVQNLLRHLPGIKAAFAPTKPFVNEDVRLQFLAQELSTQVVRDCQPSAVPEISSPLASVLPGGV